MHWSFTKLREQHRDQLFCLQRAGGAAAWGPVPSLTAVIEGREEPQAESGC